MKTNPACWAHAPEHRLHERGTYIVTCGTYRKQLFLNTPEKLTLVRDLLFELTQKYDWQLQAWAIMANHYHFVAASPADPTTLKKMLSTLHTLSAATLNRLDGHPGRRVWFNYYDTHITYEKSWFARLKYVHQNPVHHGVVQNAELYEWCSAAWFAREGGNAFVKTVNSFKIDQVKVYDDYGVRWLDTALKQGVAAAPAPQVPSAGSRSAPIQSGVKPPQVPSAGSRSAPIQSGVKPPQAPCSAPIQSGVKPPQAPCSAPIQSGVKPPHSALRLFKSGVKPPHSRCKYCNSTDIVKAGTRKLKSGIKQLYKCNACLRKFSNLNRNTKQTDPEIILKTLIATCRSATYEEIAHFIQRRYQQTISTSVISKWIHEYHPPYLKIRHLNHKVSKIVISNVFTHRDLNYNFQIHVPKLARCPLKEFKEYLIKLPTLIDHRLFETAKRCSWLKTDLSLSISHSQNTQACKDALKALQFAKTNHQRHDVVEQFMLNCDTFTIATEVPVWMTHQECAGSTALSNTIPSNLFPIAGHIDLLQWKFNTLYILDFKPNARKEQKRKVATQLLLYAIALSCRTQVPLKQMRCAWFDGEDFFSFMPD